MDDRHVRDGNEPVSIDVLGGFRARAGSRAISTTPEGSRVLALLAVHGRPLSLDDAASVLREQRDETRRALDEARTLLPRAIAVEGNGVSLARHVAVDLHEAIAYAIEALDGTASVDTAQAVLRTDGVLLLASDLLPTWDDPWIGSYARRWVRLRTKALRALLARFHAMGQARDLVRPLLEQAGWDLGRLAALIPLLPDEVAPHPFPAGALPLSPRERQIARLMADGLTNREIASRLQISERTVDAHADHIRTKLGVRSRVEIATHLGPARLP